MNYDSMAVQYTHDIPSGVKDFQKFFGSSSSSSGTTIPPSCIQELLRLSWTAKLEPIGLRGLCWRVMLGLLSHKDRGLWYSECQKNLSYYQELKSQQMPSINKVSVDPLSALSQGNSMSDEWKAFYKNVELTDFIKGDLDRLYLSGIDDEYFQTKERRDIVLAILFVWSMQNPSISYRQGMHEIVGCCLFMVEQEVNFWEVYASSTANHNADMDQAAKCFPKDNAYIEAYTYMFFERIMMELASLYDPLAVADGQPFVVQFCAKIQEHYLRILDPVLCQHLEDSFVQSQLYGLRWTRLMLGREFPVTHSHVFRLWDFMFAACFDAEFNDTKQKKQLQDEDSVPNVYSLYANSIMRGYRKETNVNAKKESKGSNKLVYVITPLLGSLGDFMLAMLIQIRDELLESDSNSVIAYVMRYPQRDSVTSLVECADMIRRGVMVRDINSNGAILNVDTFNNNNYPNGAGNGNNYDFNTRGSLVSDVLNSQVSKKVQDKFFSLKTAVGSGLNEFVQSISPLLDGFDDDPLAPPKPLPPHQRKPVSTATPYSINGGLTTPPPSAKKKPAPTSVSQKERIVDPLLGGSMSPAAAGSSGDASSVKSGSSSSTAVGSDASGPATIEEVDPLTGMVVSRPATSSAKESKRPSVTGASTSGKMAGEGTGYANLPEAMLANQDGNPTTPMTYSKTVGGAGVQTPTPGTSRQGLSLFSPNWFPSNNAGGNAAASGASSSTAANKKKDRLSVGVDLRDLHEGQPLSMTQPSSSSNATTNNSNNPNTNNGVKEGSTALRAKGNAVRDRLMEIADHLNQLSAICAHNTADPSSPPGAPVGSPSSDEEDVCSSTAKRLHALAQILSGDSSIVDYDMKFANKEFSTLLPNQVKIGTTTNSGSTTARRGSGSSTISVTAGPASIASLSIAGDEVPSTQAPVSQQLADQPKNRTDSLQSNSSTSGMDMKSVSSESGGEGDSPTKAPQDTELESV